MWSLRSDNAPYVSYIFQRMQSGVREILEALRCDRVRNDRRRHPRVGLRARVLVETNPRHGGGDAAHARAAWLRDLSAGGAGLLVSEPLRAEQTILLHLPVTARRNLGVRCRVVHCQPVGGFWRAGVEFAEHPWEGHTPTCVSDPHDAEVEGDLDREVRRISSAVLD